MRMSRTFFVIDAASGASHQIEYKPSLTVLQLKKIMGEKTGVEAGEVKLQYAGKNLDKDDMELSQYDIGPGSNVKGILTLKGGIE
jgi:hypothetical protein